MITVRKILGLLIFSSLLIGSKVKALPNLTNKDLKLDNIPQENYCSAEFKKHETDKEQFKIDKLNPIIQAKIPLNNISIPSLWWAQEQFDPFGGRLVENWLAYPQIRQIDLIINWQLWTVLDYLGRYRFVNQFGTVVRKYGYSLNVLDRDKQCLATYKYNSLSNPPKWEIQLERLGKDSLQVEQEVN
jgi:hypothetical protein